MVSKRHKVFISFHHDADQEYANHLRDLYGKSHAIIDKSMYKDMSHLSTETILNKIRKEHLMDSTVTIVLVGEHTWGRKWVDWEIYSSLRPYGYRTRNGLVGIYLPNHRKKHSRLTDNIHSGYAVAIKWEEIDEKLIDAIHQAWNNRRRPELIDNSRQLRERNASLERRIYDQDNEGCFIATAAYGTSLAPEIDVLRKWRDERLKTTLIGMHIIFLYYKHGPLVAKHIKSNCKLRLITQWIVGALLRVIQ